VFANSLFANTAPDPLAPRTNTTHTNEQVFANVFANVSERRTLRPQATRSEVCGS